MDSLRIANWQRSKDGMKGRNKPKPISPLAKSPKSKHYGKTDMSPSEMTEHLARWRSGDLAQEEVSVNGD